MNSLKQRWENFRSQARSNLVRSNSFTMQLSPSFFKDARLTNNNNHQKSTTSLSALSCSSEKGRGPCVFPTTVQPSQQKVRYIFGTRLQRRPSCLRMLQEPLRDVYLAYMTKNSSVPGIIGICPEGLRVQYARYDGTDIEEFTNSFQSIAYWAAVQCVVRAHTQNGQNGLHIGFFPFFQNGQWLVQGSDHRSAKGLPAESAFMWLAGEDQHQSLLKTDHPPLFACVMRQKASRSLFCHVFICSSSQQAIALASALYDVVKVNLRQSVPSSSKRPKPASHGKNSAKGPKRVKKKHGVSSQKQQDDQQLRGPKAVGPQRSCSFSHLMTGLRRLAIKDLVPVPEASRRHKAPSLRKSKGARPCSSPQLVSLKSPPRTNAETSKRQCRSRFITALGSSSQGVGHMASGEDSNWKYQVLRPGDSPPPPAPPPRPRWMRLLMNLTLGHEGRGKRTPVFNLSRAQRRRGSLRPLTSSKAQVAVVLASKGQWLNRRCSRSAVPLLTCTCSQGLKSEGRRVSAMLQTPAQDSKSRNPTSSSGDSDYLSMGPSQNRRLEDAYVEIQDSGRSRPKCRPKAPEPFSVSENNLFNKQMLLAAVPCTIGRDAALDDDSDSFNSSMAPSAPSFRSGGVVSPERMCPHMANPQLVFRKLLPGGMVSKRKYGWNLTKTCNEQKPHNGPLLEETPLLKKDAEIVSILDQIANKVKTPQNKCTSDRSDRINVEACDGEELQGRKPGESDLWGWATFLP